MHVLLNHLIFEVLLILVKILKNEELLQSFHFICRIEFYFEKFKMSANQLPKSLNKSFASNSNKRRFESKFKGFDQNDPT